MMIWIICLIIATTPTFILPLHGRVVSMYREQTRHTFPAPAKFIFIF